jgi:peroxiredoxin
MKHLLCSVIVLGMIALPATAATPTTQPAKTAAKPAKKLASGDKAPDFHIKDASGADVNLADLSAKGPVLVRLTCGCLGCDKELAYFQKIDEAYRAQGLTTLLVFREPDEKVAKYAADKKLNVRYAVDAKGESWKTFQTTAMPVNFLIDKGGKIISVAQGCDPGGLIANIVSEKAANAVGASAVDVKKQVAESNAPKTDAKK